MSQSEGIRVLLVGCGGIGVEVLHNLLYLLNLQELDLVDMDVVERSNLSRQYLFTEDDIGSYKAEVCAKYFTNRRSDVITRYFVAAIQDKREFEAPYFGRFDYVINALDNIEARVYVAEQIFVENLLPYKTARTVLVDAGTAGLAGSVTFYADPQKMEVCCRKEVQDAPIPVCTLRSHPTEPKHCAAFAKYLVERVLGGAENELLDFTPIELPLDRGAALEVIRRLTDEEPRTGADVAALNIQTVLSADQAAAIMLSLLTVDGAFPQPFRYNKDDRNTRILIGCITTLRCHAFGITPISTFEAATLADRIIPALGFSNAAAASLVARHICQGTCGDQLYLLTGRFPYILADTNTDRLEPCDFCSQEFGLCGRYCLSGVLYNLDGTELACDPRDNEWFSDTPGLPPMPRRNELYIQRNGDRMRYVYISEDDMHGYITLRAREVFEASPEDVGSSISEC